MSTSSLKPLAAMGATPAFKDLAMAIDPRIPSDRASELLYDFYSAARATTVARIRFALLGTTDGGEVSGSFEIPAGEIARILDELAGGAR